MSITRRNVLAAGVAGAAGVTLAACGGDGESEPSDAGGQAEPTAAPATGPAATGDALVPAADVPVEGGVIVDSGETKVVVTQPTVGEYVGLSAVCPHQNCLVAEVSDQRIICPCHGSQFSIADGSVIQGPATEGLSSVAVEVDGDQIVLG
jgi:nitrite reductase/ring-hydroxylating ferredoxin subunit